MVHFEVFLTTATPTAWIFTAELRKGQLRKAAKVGSDLIWVGHIGMVWWEGKLVKWLWMMKWWWMLYRWKLVERWG